MKPLVCEMCGSKDLIKQDGVFVCQYCGCKYSVEEAKKMMIDGTVDVKGTVQIDNTESVEKYLQNARRAKEKEDWEEVEKYYNLVEQNDPTNIEAIFYSAYGKLKMSLLQEDMFKRQHVVKVFINCISILDDKYNIEKSAEEEMVIKEISKDIDELMGSEFVFTEKVGQLGTVVESNKEDTLKLFLSIAAAFEETINNIIAKDNKPYLHQIMLEHYSTLKRCPYIQHRSTITKYNDKMMYHHKQWNKLDSTHTVPEPDTTFIEEENRSMKVIIGVTCGVFGLLACGVLLALIF